MTLTTHAVVGAFVGAVAAHNPPLAIAAAFASHFLLDTIPHWDYSVSSVKQDKNNLLNTNMTLWSPAFFRDISKISFDFFLGLALVVLLFHQQSRYIFLFALIGGLLGMLPDLLQFIYWKFRHEPLISLQKFHVLFMHAKSNLNTEPFLGISTQLAILVVIAMLVLRFFA